jgi:D-sedoheptulose 7-phosphate isomerase
VLTAWGNDYGFDTVFSRQVEAHGWPAPCCWRFPPAEFAKHPAAAEQARMMDMTVISLTGDTGGKLKPLSDILLNVLHLDADHPAGASGLYHPCEVVEARLSNG